MLNFHVIYCHSLDHRCLAFSVAFSLVTMVRQVQKLQKYFTATSKVPSQSFGCLDLSTHTWRCRSTNSVARRLACSPGDIKLSFQVLWMLWILTAVCLICIHVRVFMLLSCIGQRSLSNSGVLEGLLNLLDSLLSPLQQPQAAAQRRTEGKATENSVFAAPDMLT